VSDVNETTVGAIDVRQDEEVSPEKMRLVVTASAAGTVFEWYDFFIFGALATIISKHFYSGVNETAGFIYALLTFAAGFAFRPLGALVFGRSGDAHGRKGAFLVTMMVMGLATFAIGLLPDYEQIGIFAPILLIICRILQGFALGGEYGGAAIYVAEHSPQNARGFNTSWIQTSAALGLFSALGVILLVRTVVGEEAFQDWGWRLPFMLSLALLAVSMWIRLQLQESPAFTRMKEEGAQSKAPFKEAFAEWKSLKIVLIVLFGIMIAQGVVWYTGFFYTQFFLEKTLHVEPRTVNIILITITAVSAFQYVFFGWLSDKVGRKPVMLAGMVLMLVAYFPGFHILTQAANPALAQAQLKSPVLLHADPDSCSLQFDPIGKANFASSCDVAKSVLASRGIPYDNVDAPKGSLAFAEIGSVKVESVDGIGMATPALKAARDDVAKRLKEALTQAGYPEKADPAQMNFFGIFGIMLIFSTAATALFGPLAACLVELFPTRVRYTGMSLPYNIGTGWFGGFLPAIALAIVAATGNIFAGLWYPFLITCIAVVIFIFFVPETRHRDIRK
jgi:MFS family permease